MQTITGAPDVRMVEDPKEWIILVMELPVAKIEKTQTLLGVFFVFSCV